MRRERMELGVAAFPTEDVGFSYHHYNPEDPAFYRTAPAAFAYHGLAEEARRFRQLVGPARELAIWEFNNAGVGFGSHEPGVNAQGGNVLETVNAGADLAWKTITALANGVDGLCLWHLHDSDVNHFGLWRWREGEFRCKPIWHYYAALCRAFRPGQRVVRVADAAPPIAAVAATDATHGWSVAVLNNSAAPSAVRLDLPAAGGWRQQRIAPPGLAEADETRVAEDEPLTKTEFTLAPWELLICRRPPAQ